MMIERKKRCNACHDMKNIVNFRKNTKEESG
jgi:hypothetical protein